MTDLESVLLYELRAIPLSPSDLQVRLSTWDIQDSPARLVQALRTLRQEGLVDGPGMSAIHKQPVWLTAAGETRARNLRDVGGWLRVGSGR